jgi:uncharacterized membrane protein YccC
MIRKLETVRSGLNWGSLEHSARTAVVATASLLVARVFKLPEAYWAPITALVVTQSTLGAAWTISRQRLVGTALGAGLGALLALHPWSLTAMFGVAIFGTGLVCAMLHLDRAAYRFTGITLAIIILVERDKPAWTIAMDRFLEVTVGILIALALTAVWPEHERPVPGATAASKAPDRGARAHQNQEE